MSEEENQTDSTENVAGENAAEDAVASEGPKPENASNQITDSGKPDTAEIIAKSISGKDVNIDALLKVPVSLAIEVGRTKLNLNDLLGTREGSVIELDRHLDEPLDILVNGALIAHGIVVLANEKFGLQITDIISLEERARSL
ncbi:MAG: flagellar motor switch protein FliN [SAR86 cluster bacterium]|uniref:Flagellar motor switch protein FliN n=1 Tax=SAR86 cluster bacterium TaxID=2030880 RepID=A0A2A4XHS6_9GAMM|nr:MAG: flagellar motor switch protein FliN [SAR86 cluster bacterium]